MNNLPQDTEQKQFNDEPVFYCKHCLSLAIKSIQGLDFCDSCGSTEIEEAHITEWESKFKEKNGVEFLNIKNNGSKNENGR